MTTTVLVWHVHGSWMTSFVQGPHRSLIPHDPRWGTWALGRCGRPWPDRAEDITPEALADEHVDVVVVQRPRELELARRWLRRTPGVDVPLMYVEHSPPTGHAATTRHPMADRDDLTLVHVTEFNRLMWDNGDTRVRVVPHGVLDPGDRYTGELERVATIVDEPLRRWRVTGTDLLADLSDAAPVDVFGVDTEQVHTAVGRPRERVFGHGDLRQDRVHAEMARRRVFAHTPRWTSLGPSVLEAMHLGMPIVAVGTTEAAAAVPPEAGVVSADAAVLARAVARYVREPDLARLAGKAARHWAQANFGIAQFVEHWNDLLAEAVEDGPR
ncbi:glycosyltransferase [Nocardia neocaledoniensis]|uniref:Glycosyl transferase family 1 n=1 Tax=Nocardia neocaledoniensis TaxID=236511 RepID=A0A317NCX7_9NOCA|nr:glycosyltransferase [Nocardia neocaledoniensis]PWV72773.1 glycosyl transferase family 1 [Nocardia neocaledoniensis]